MLAAALEAEVDAYLAELVDERDEDGHRLVTRNGHARQRKVQTRLQRVARPFQPFRAVRHLADLRVLFG